MKKKLFSYMSVVEESYPDAPDGAWQQMLEDAVDSFNNENKTNYDSFDMFLEYVADKS